jgi:hypothetical protein
MRLYTVHLCHHGLDLDRDIILVKEGFSWPAFFFSFIWALWCRLWWVAAGLLTVQLAVTGLIALIGPDEVSDAAISLGLAVVIGFAGNDLKRWTLSRRGYSEVGVVGGKDREAAEQRFFQFAADQLR